jgi:hypothetical protein
MLCAHPAPIDIELPGLLHDASPFVAVPAPTCASGGTTAMRGVSPSARAPVSQSCDDVRSRSPHAPMKA